MKMEESRRCCWSSSFPLILALLFLLMTTSSKASSAQPSTSTQTTAPSSSKHPEDQQPDDDDRCLPSQPEQLDSKTIQAYEALDKWKLCDQSDLPTRLVYQHNRSRAAATGFPTRLKTGSNLGLTDHETAAIFGWTTGDYRFINPIARGLHVAEFDEYPFLPNKLTKVKCRLYREDVVPYVTVLHSALSKLPDLPSRHQRLWRGHRRKVTPSAKIGSIVTMEGFVSVTRDRESALEFATKANEGRSNERTLVAFLEHSSAKCVAKLSARSGETEALFPPGAMFEVVEPPGDMADEDGMAVRRAVERMRQNVPGADIDLVYVREVFGD